MTASQFVHGLKYAFLTPAGFFVLCCFLAPLLLKWVDPTITDDPLNYSSLFTAKPVILWFSICFLVIYHTFQDKEKLDYLVPSEVWIASWYLINGFFFNSMMDVFAGQFQCWPVMTDFYNALEPRYSKVGTYEGVTVQLTSWQEILIQTPCGLLLFYAYWRRMPWRYPLEIIFNMWSVAGVWYFYLSEPILNFPHVHHPFKKDSFTFDSMQAFTFETVWKFWIGFVIFPGLWAAIGLYLTYRAFTLLSLHVENVETYYKSTGEEIEKVVDDLKGLLIQLEPGEELEAGKKPRSKSKGRTSASENAKKKAQTKTKKKRSTSKTKTTTTRRRSTKK
jgi:hypothetical protein